jgi:hypothetical protein
MAEIFGRMPWNKSTHCKTRLPNPDLSRSCQ